MLHEIVAWLQANWIELFGVVSALSYLYFSIRQHIALWALGILTSGLYLVVYFGAGLYADMALSLYYIVVSGYGWYYWLAARQPEQGYELPVSTLSFKLGLQYLGATVILYFGTLAALLHLPALIGIPPASMPLLDAFTTAASVVGTYMLARKLLEQWLVWVVVDVVSACMYVYKGLHLTAGLYIVYTVMALYGYMAWKKTLTPRYS